MPAEPMTVLLRPRNFFTKNPALDVPPSWSSTPSAVAAAAAAAGKKSDGSGSGSSAGVRGVVDGISRLAFGGGEKKEGGGGKNCGGGGC